MRGFGATWLRKQRTPEDPIRFWLGHANQSVTDGCSKLADNVEFRKQVAEKIGSGFDVPAYEKTVLVPMRARKQKKIQKAAAA